VITVCRLTSTNRPGEVDLGQAELPSARPPLDRIRRGIPRAIGGPHQVTPSGATIV
jgi:hypothetical protein